MRGGHREVVTSVGRLEHGPGGDHLGQVVAGPLAGQRQAVAEPVHRPVHVAEGVRRDGLHQPQLAGPVGVVGQRRGDPPVLVGRPVDAVPERRPGDLQPRPLPLGHPPARQQPLGPGQARPDALHEQPPPAQRQRDVDGGVDLPGLQEEAEGIEVVVVRAPDVLDQLVGQRRVPPQPGEPLRVPGAGDVQPSGSGELLEGQVAHGPQHPERHACIGPLDGDQVVRREVGHHAFGLGRSETSERAGSREVESSGEDGEPEQRDPAGRLEPADAPRDGAPQRLLTCVAADLVGLQVERVLDDVEQVADRDRRGTAGDQLQSQGQPVDAAGDLGQHRAFGRARDEGRRGRRAVR